VRERERVCVCVCVRERDRERECVCERERDAGPVRYAGSGYAPLQTRSFDPGSATGDEHHRAMPDETRSSTGCAGSGDEPQVTSLVQGQVTSLAIGLIHQGSSPNQRACGVR
jgi:hypothetical protein